MADGIHTDYSKRVVVHTSELEYSASPARGVWRKRLELLGNGESGRVTSVVRYDPGARFPEHGHPEGEEILVLSGELCDERGSFKAGCFQLNPEGFVHAPFTVEGCTLFVKLRHYGGAGRRVVLVDTENGHWVERGMPGVRSQELYRSERYGEHMRLTELLPRTQAPRVSLPDGEEIFVLRGSCSDEYGTYETGTWLRMPKGFAHAPKSEQGCVLYVRSGGFPRLP